MKLSLNTKIIKADHIDQIKNIIILFHGYGGDGNDISMLTLNWKRFLPNTIFLCPDGHERCALNQNGFQWFDLNKDEPEYILENSLKAEKVIHRYVNEVKDVYKINNSQLCLLGFSQGCMMSINVGLTSSEKYNCIIGFSGKIINKDNLSKRITSKTKTLLLHGDLDVIVDPSNLLEAKDFFIRNNIPIETNMIEDCEHQISTKGSSIALNYLKKNFSV